MTAWTAQAQLLAGELREPGYAAAEANARAWRARVRPEATRGLVAAALILTGGDAGAALWAAAKPCPDDRALRGWASELEAHVAELLRHCRDMLAACTREMEAALREHASASAAAEAARGRMAAAADPEAHAAAEADHEAAMERMHAAALVIAGCETAAEILRDAAGRLGAALDALRQVPEDLHDIYETPYRYVRENGPLPRDGDFLTAASR